MTDHSRFVGDSSDLKITRAPGPRPPEEPWFDTTNLRLKELRHHAGLTQAQVAEKIGMRSAHISRLEGSEDARLSTIIAYVSALGGQVVLELPDRREELRRVA